MMFGIKGTHFTISISWYIQFHVIYKYHISMVSCQKGPPRHAYAWQIGPFWQDTLDLWVSSRLWYPMLMHSIYHSLERRDWYIIHYTTLSEKVWIYHNTTTAAMLQAMWPNIAAVSEIWDGGSTNIAWARSRHYSIFLWTNEIDLPEIGTEKYMVVSSIENIVWPR